jgi:hypothetical protein
MEWLKSKFVWINAIAIIVEILQYFITNNMFPNATVIITAVIAILTIIANAIAGATMSVRVAKLKAQVKILTGKIK